MQENRVYGVLIFPRPPNKRFQRTRRRVAFIVSCLGEPLKRNVMPYLPNQPIGLPDKSTHTLLTFVYISSACLPISRP